MRREYIIACLILLLVMGVLAARWADRRDWISHSMQVNVMYADTWKAGEVRDCNSVMSGSDVILACAMYPGEIVRARPWNVTLHGRIGGEERNWMCRHDQISIVCKPSK
jgi:hypothetical protein